MRFLIFLQALVIFEKEEDNLKTIKAIKSNLKEHGFGVIDFLNVDFVLDNLVASEVKQVEHIEFHIKRYLKDGFIHKDISFSDKGKDFNFTERVKAFRLKDFENYFEAAGLTLLEVYGDFNLNKYQSKSSPRLIMIFQ